MAEKHSRTVESKIEYEVVDVAPATAQLLFPRNTFSATITGDHVMLSVSTDIHGLPGLKRRLELLRELLAVPMDQPPILSERKMVAGDIYPSARSIPVQDEGEA